MPPTLLQRGKVRHANYAIPSTLTAVEYIVSTVQKRIQMPATWDSRVLVVKAQTGSGKSSVMPVELFRLLRNPQFSGPLYKGKSVLCTQPRVITARDLAETQIAKAPYYPDMQLEDTVGYRTGEFKTEKTRHMLLYATIGAFRQILINQTDEEIRDSYQFIIVDEAHERSLDTDLTLMEIKYFMQRNMGREDLPMLILTSATIDENKYARYFNVGDDCIITVAGFTYPILVNWGEDEDNIVDAVVDKVIDIHDSNPNDPVTEGAVMVFVHGLGAFKDVKPKLESERPDILVALADRNNVQNQTRDYFYVTGKIPLPRDKKRLVILATNAAETGLTVDSLKYVVDTGWSNMRELYYPHDVSGIIMRPIAESNARQRKGRCGRLRPGEVHFLYSQETGKAMRKQQFPNIVTEGVEETILELIIIQQRNKAELLKLSKNVDSDASATAFRAADLELLDPPPIDALTTALDKCVALGFVSPSAILPNAERGLSNTDDDIFGATEELRRGYGITNLGLFAQLFQRPLPGLEPPAIILYSYLFPSISARDSILVAYAASSQSGRMPQIGKTGGPTPTRWNELKKIMGCQILETAFIYAWAIEEDVDLDVGKLAYVYDDALSILAENRFAVRTGPTLVDLAKLEDLDAFAKLAADLKRVLSIALRFNVLRNTPDGLVTRHGYSLRARLPDYFPKTEYVLSNRLILKKNFRGDTTYFVTPEKLCAIEHMDVIAEPDDTNDAAVGSASSASGNLDRLYLYLKLLEIQQ